MPPQPPQQPQSQGPIDRVPCPHCGKANNFRRVDEMLEVGNVFGCDHCKKPMQIAGVKDIRIVAVRKPGAGRSIQRRR
jgi:NAD-dependent SIR2 family protein deacetylase